MAIGSAAFIRVDVSASDTALGCWTMCTWAPAHGDPLGNLVSGIWDFDGTTAHRRERVFPTGKFEIVVQLDQPHRPIVGGGCDGPFPSACISGMQIAPMVIEGPPARMRVLGLRLHPVGAFALLGIPLDELTGGTVHIADVLGATGVLLEARLHDARDGVSRVRATLDWVARRLERSALADEGVAWAIAHVERDPAVPIARLQRESGLDRTRFAVRFRATTGTTAKQFARLVRVRHALALLRADDRITLGEAALQTGYYDQPHMNADFRRFTGLTPGEFRAALRYPDGMHTAE